METLLPFEKLSRQIVVKKESVTDDRYGCRPADRAAGELISSGIVNVDKPAGPSSHQVSAYVKQILGIKKSGHGGTLDPNVVGILPVALGSATRIVQVLLTAGKEYVCLMQVHKEVDEKKLKEICDGFVGKITQIPPVKSSVVRRKRERTIYYFEILEIKGKYVLFRVGCQAGTYIRKLVSDVGSMIGGAHMVELRRTKAGPFNEGNLSTLHDLMDAFHYHKNGSAESLKKVILPVEAAVAHLPKVWIADSAVDSLCHGTSLKMPGISRFETGIKSGDVVAVMTLKDELVCYGESVTSSEKMESLHEGIAVKPDAVFMKTGTYPERKQGSPQP